MDKYIRIRKQDTVAVALEELSKGTAIVVDEEKIILQDNIPKGHKFALEDIKEGSEVYKYGYSIGRARCDIHKGRWVHTHNLITGLDGILEYKYEKISNTIEPTESRSFMGYRRSDGRVGVRNEIWIIPTVGCVNNVAQSIAQKAKEYIKGNIDGIYAFTHPYGCSQLGDDQNNTRRILAALANHPNAGGVLILGLGCENSNIDEIRKVMGSFDDKRVRFLAAQEHEDEIESSLKLIKELIEYAGGLNREAVCVSELIVGLKCGGSDGLSGITANPVTGVFSDTLISKGGTTILTEVPEMFGAETILMNRCADEKVFHKTVSLINDFKEYFISHGQQVYENPSPGNKAGGITTLEDKSLGCTQKSGTAQVSGVIGYGERVNVKGLNLLSAPGNDLVAATALAAAGAQIVLFTTGRGTPFSCPVPTVKLSTNTELKERKNKWIDFDCGSVVKGTSIEKLADRLFEYVIDVASGKYVKAEEAGYHDMAIFKQGVTL